MCKLTHRTSVCVAGVVASNLSLVVPFAAPMLLRIQRNNIISLFGVSLFGCSMLFLFYFCCLIFYLPFWLLTSFYSPILVGETIRNPYLIRFGTIPIYPTFTPQQVARCLLATASRFYTQNVLCRMQLGNPWLHKFSTLILCCIWMGVCVYIYICICIYMCICIYIYTYVCMYICWNLYYPVMFAGYPVLAMKLVFFSGVSIMIINDRLI